MVKSLNYFIKFIYGNGFKDISPPKKIKENRKTKHKKILMDGGRALFMTQDERDDYIKTVLADRTGKSLGASIPYNLDTAKLMALLRIGRLERALGQQYVADLLKEMGGQDGIIKQVPTGVDLRAFILSHRPLAKEWYKMNNLRPIRTPSNIPSTPYHKVKNGMVSKYNQAKRTYYRKSIPIDELVPIIAKRMAGKTKKMPKGLKNFRIRKAARNFQRELVRRKDKIDQKNKESYSSVMDDAKSKAESRELSEKEKKFIDDLQKKFKDYKDKSKAKKTSKSKKHQSSSPPPQPPPSDKPSSPRTRESLVKAFKQKIQSDKPPRLGTRRRTGMDVLEYEDL